MDAKDLQKKKLVKLQCGDKVIRIHNRGTASKKSDHNLTRDAIVVNSYVRKLMLDGALTSSFVPKVFNSSPPKKNNEHDDTEEHSVMSTAVMGDRELEEERMGDSDQTND